MKEENEWLLIGESYKGKINANTRLVRDCVDVMVNFNMSVYYGIDIFMDNSCNEECQEMYKLLLKNEEGKC